MGGERQRRLLLHVYTVYSLIDAHFRWVDELNVERLLDVTDDFGDLVRRLRQRRLE